MATTRTGDRSRGRHAAAAFAGRLRTSWRQPLQRRLERARARPCASAIASHLHVVVVTTEPFADLARQQRRRARRRRPARGRPRRRGRRSAWALDRRRRRRPAGCRRLAGPAGRHAAGAAGDAASRWRALLDTMRWPMRSTAAGAAIRSASLAELYSELHGARRRRRRAAPGRPLPGVRRRARRSRRADRHRHRGRPGMRAARRARRRPSAAARRRVGAVRSALRRASATRRSMSRSRMPQSRSERRRLHQVGEGAAVAAVGGAQDLEHLLVVDRGRCGSGCAGSSVKARARHGALRRAAGQPVRVVDAGRHLARPEPPQLGLDARRARSGRRGRGTSRPAPARTPGPGIRACRG